MKDWSGFIQRMDDLYPEDKSRIMCTCSYIHLGKVVIGLLKYNLDHRKEKGVLFSIERPHSYIENQVKKQGIPDEGLKFIGAVQNISSEKLKSNENVEIIDSPFCKNLVNEAMFLLTREIDSGDIGFIIVDNFRALANYVKLDCLYNFILPIVKKVEDNKKPKIFMLVDHRKLPELPKECGQLCQSHIDITPEWFD